MSQPQKISHVVRRFVFDEWGGTEAVVWNTSLGLIKEGTPSNILATSALDHVGKQTKQNCSIERFPYFYPRLGLSQQNKLNLDKKGGDPYSISLFRSLLAQDIRIIHSHSMQRVAATCRVAAKMKDIPYVMSLHGGQFTVPQSEIVDMKRSTKRSFNYGRFADIFTQPHNTLNDASGIICVGYDEYQAVRKQHPNKPCVYLPNGVNTDVYTHGNPSSFRHEHGIDPDKQVILCVSRIDPQKNQLSLVELLRKLKEKTTVPYHLVLIGPVTNADYRDQIQATIDRYQLAGDCTLIEGVEPESQALVNAYKAADLFILPSVHEPFGIVVLEAWAAGVPVIASNIGGLAHLVSHQNTGLHFNPYKEQSLMDTVHYLSLDKNLGQVMANNAIKEAQNRYSWQSYIKRLQNFYDDVESWHRNRKSKVSYSLHNMN